VRLLVLGGTRFLGRHVAELAVARGDDVALFTRGRTNPGLVAGAEHLVGDRDGGLHALRGRRFDAVVDTSGYVPRTVSQSAQLLAPAVDRYVFVSSASVYADPSRPGLHEGSPVAELTEPGSEDVGAHYGALKALCEREVLGALPDRSVAVRAGLIVGPHDPTGRFTWWVARLDRGGEVLAPEPPDQPVQFVDVRDLAAWILRLADGGGEPGVYNAVGPAEPLTMAGMLDTIRAAIGSDAHLVWVPERVLDDAGVGMWMDLPLWLAPGLDPGHAGFLSVDASRARAAGLTFRPLADTARDTLAWLRESPPLGAGAPTGPPPGLEPGRERAILDALER
jgi:2'-hydroxyisoflavone reductase